MGSIPGQETKIPQAAWHGNQSINFLKGTNELIHKTQIDLQTQKTSLWLPKGKGVGDKLGVWD